MTKFPLDIVETVGTGLRGPEGVVLDRSGNIYGGGSDGMIRRVTPEGKVSDVANTGGRPLGMTFDRDGNLFVCDPGLPGIAKVNPQGEVSLFADRVGEDRLTVPNFCVFDANGNLYVSNSTTRSFADFQESLGRPDSSGALYCLRPDGSGVCVAKGLYFANGLAIDPEESAVYVLETARDDVVRIPILGEGRYGESEVYCDHFPAAPDGMAFDRDGNLIVTIMMEIQKGPGGEGNRIIAIDRDRTVATLLHDPEGTRIYLPTNCAFGAPNFDQLYLASLERDYFCRFHYGIVGHPLYHQR